MALLIFACGSPAAIDAGSNDAGRDGGSDAGSLADAGMDGRSDAGNVLDAGTPPAGVITGTCGVLDDELTSPMPYFFSNEMFFDEPWSSADTDRISEGGAEILRDGTAGGSSGYSEVFAFEVLHRCEGAELIKSETEIVYDTPGRITDILVRIDGMPIGVSVTRAVTVTGMCMRADTYTEMQAEDLLTDKLTGINESTMNVSAEDRWVKQILFVLADTMAGVDMFRTVWERLDPTLRADTILYVSMSTGMDGWIYFEDRCPSTP